jgi:N-acetylglucosaminyldiphosphoundecaprenol N-acetyl-beta-D-mannosaminyltransferase
MSSQPRLPSIANVKLGSPRRERIAIGDALVDRCSFDEAISDITAHAQARGVPAYVVTPNAQHIVLLARDTRLREIYQEAELVVPDGFSLLLAARALGNKFPERVPGVDLFQALCGSAARSGLRVFLLGGRPGSADLAASTMQNHFPNLQVDTYCPPFGFENSEIELARVRQAVTLFRPDLLFVALGAPKQEYWIYEHGRKLGAAVCVGVGGSFELVNGMVPRAPRWIQNIGFEWLYRLGREPRRMWRRYLIGNIQFAWIILRQALAGGPRTQPEKARAALAGDRSR